MASVESSFLPLPFVDTWARRKKGNTLTELEVTSSFFEHCVTQMNEVEWQPFQLHNLPDPIPANPKGRLFGKCHVIRYRSPFDFHLVFLDGNNPEEYPEFNLCLYNSAWTQILVNILKDDKDESMDEERALSKFCFESTEELFTGLSHLLGKFVLFLYHAYGITNPESPDRVAARKELSQGDLVVADVLRGGENDMEKVCYRGVVVEKLERFSHEHHQPFRIYLIDIGEMMIVERKFMRPLPKAFVGFRPMAVKCALHGIMPIGPDWNRIAREEMKTVMKSMNDGKLIAEFRCDFGTTLQPSEQKRNFESTSDHLHKLLNSTPHFVELTFVSNWPKVKPVNFSSHLLENKLAIEWTLIPNRRYLRSPFPPVNKNDKKKSKMSNPPITRLEALSLSQGNPFKVKSLHPDELRLEIDGCFNLNKRLEEQVFGGLVPKNIFAIKIHDPENKKAFPSVPKVFHKGKESEPR